MWILKQGGGKWFLAAAAGLGVFAVASTPAAPSLPSQGR
jgi:hypothetical protein